MVQKIQLQYIFLKLHHLQRERDCLEVIPAEESEKRIKTAKLVSSFLNTTYQNFASPISIGGPADS